MESVLKSVNDVCPSHHIILNNQQVRV